WTPQSTLIIVLLPAPFSPSSAWISPASHEKSAAWSATTPPNRLSMPVAESNGMASDSKVPGTDVPIWWRLDLLRLDLLDGQIDATSRDLDRREEVVLRIREDVYPWLERLGGCLRQRHGHPLRDLLALEQVERHADGDADEGRRLADREAVDVIGVLQHLLAEAVLGLAGER